MFDVHRVGALGPGPSSSTIMLELGAELFTGPPWFGRGIPAGCVGKCSRVAEKGVGCGLAAALSDSMALEYPTPNGLLLLVPPLVRSFLNDCAVGSVSSESGKNTIKTKIEC